MSDQGFDLCECTWNNELAVRRLLSILRQTQYYCNDNECSNFSRLPNPHVSSTTDFMLVCLIFGFVALLYAFRPNSLRGPRYDEAKSENGGLDNTGNPPMPPPTAN